MLKIIDFGSSTRVTEETQNPTTTPGQLKQFYGTLAYISPEQTGRVNSVIDYRSDLYSLGVTLYQLISGSLPFLTCDVIELVHSHIAVEPPPLPPHIPTVLSDIIMKLMRKSVTDRYQSCTGLLHDLEECRRRLDRLDHIEWFPIGMKDITRRFHIPKKLYGREREVHSLLSTFERVASTGITELLIVQGYSGIGKSSLINEVQKPICLRNGYFLSGKYDQLERNVAYSAICDALRKFVKQILGESDESMLNWREKILNAVGNNGQLLINIIGPEFETLIGKQPTVIDLPPQEAKNRFEYVLAKFISVIADLEHPIVLFLDDLQWIDRESVQCIRIFLERAKYLLILGAYRDNEVTDSHPISLMINQVVSTNIAPVLYIKLSPLEQSAVLRWIQDTLHVKNDANSSSLFGLVELVYQKTEGNPFFVSVFLRSLYEEGLLVVDSHGVWEWDLDRIKQQKATENVADFMRERILHLEGYPKIVLEWASSLGNRFEMEKLGYLLNRGVHDLQTEMEPILNSGMAYIVGDEFFFAHDRVQEAAYSLLSHTMKQEMHYTIGRRLIEYPSDYANEFEIVDHLNKGIDILLKNKHSNTINVPELESLTDDKTHDQLIEQAEYNLKVSRMAEASAAYSSALHYLTTGITCFRRLYTDENECWERNYDIGFALHQSLANIYEILSEYDKSNEEINLLLTRAKTRIQRAEVYCMRIKQLNPKVGGALQAIDVGREALNVLDIHFSKDTAEILQQGAAEIQKVEEWMDRMRKRADGRDMLRVIQESMPETVDDEMSVAFNILSNLIVAGFLADPVAFQLVVPLGLRYSTTNKLTADTSTAFLYMAVLFIALGKTKLGTEIGTLGYRMSLEVFSDDLPQKTRTMHVYQGFVLPWCRPLREAEPICKEIYIIGPECGELQFPGYMITMSIFYCFYRGDALDQQQDHAKYEAFVKKTQNMVAISFFPLLRLIINTLQGTRDIFDSPSFDDYEQILETKANPYCHATFRTAKLMIHFLLDYDIHSEEHALQLYRENSEIDSLLPFIVGLYTTAIFIFYDALYIIRLLPLVNKLYHDEMKNRLKGHVTRLEGYAELCPANTRSKLLLVQAEMAAYIDCNPWDAFRLYDESIECARKEKFTHELALAFELAGKFAASQKMTALSHNYLKSCFKKYNKWGATKKLDLLQSKYPFLRRKHAATAGLEKMGLALSKKKSSSASSMDTSASGSGHSTARNSSGALTTVNLALAVFDMENIMRASEIISSTIDMDDLLVNIMKTIVETAGATNGAIILDNHVSAQYHEVTNEDESSITIGRVPLNLWTSGCASAVDFVSRTQEILVFGNAMEDQQYVFISSNTHIIQEHVKSLLVMPVTRNGDLTAVLYLENNLIGNCFTNEKINVLSILTGQMAISIENSRYFNTQIKAAEELAHLQKNKAEEAELFRQKQEEFIDRICHEIRNPIQGIVGNCDILRSDIKTLTANQNQLQSLDSYISAIQSCAQYQKIITDDVLLLSKLELKEVVPDKAPFRPSSLLQLVVRMFGSEARKKHLDLSIDMRCEDITVSGDCNLIRTCLVNLTANAIKFTQQGSVILSLNHKKKDDMIELEFCVQDTGCGLTEKEKSAIFNRFAQATQRTYAEFGGSGLGLFICKNIARTLGGDLTVESKKDEWTKFTFTILVEPSQDKEEIVKPIIIETPVEKVSNHMNVLVVEDTKINQKVIVRMLKNVGCECMVANDGVEAIEMFKKHSFDIIFMDVAMPRMDGCEATREIRIIENERGSAKLTPIIGLSGNVRFEHQDAGIRAGMSSYLCKPVTQTDIRNAINQYRPT